MEEPKLGETVERLTFAFSPVSGGLQVVVCGRGIVHLGKCGSRYGVLTGYSRALITARPGWDIG